MVCLCVAGGRLNAEVKTLFDEASRIYEQGDFGAAAALYNKILSLSPSDPDALHALGLIAQRAHKPQLALTLFEDALKARPDFPLARFNRSVILHLLGRDEEALQSARMAADGAPEMAEARDMIGQILKNKGDHAGAEANFVRAIQLQPDNAHFYGNYALLLFARGELAAACQAAARAEKLDPAYPPHLLGNILMALGYPEKAAERFARTRMLRPDFAEAAASEAMARLQMGDMERGWELWEQRPDLDKSVSAFPLWRGQKTDHLLLYEDQGIGDALQFMRYISLAKTRATRVSLRVKQPLVRLCAGNFAGINIIPESNALPAADVRCRLSSLPALFAARLDTLPAVPYITSAPGQRAVWHDILRAVPFPRIGLVRAGNAKFHNDAHRSIKFSALQPLIACGAKHFVSMQKDHPAGDEAMAASGILDAAPHMHDFADTAALVAELDLVITVDTAVAHLAGAMGKPVFVLLPFSGDWRWLIGRKDSPWYPAAHLFRQKKTGDWASVIENVAGDVKKLVAGDCSVLMPPVPQQENLRQNPDALSLPL